MLRCPVQREKKTKIQNYYVSLDQSILIAATAIALSEQFQINVPYAFNRKEAKDHGEGGIIVGAPLTGKVLVIDDVITAGTAIRESLTILESQNAQLAGVVISLDRQERGQGQLSAIQEIEQSQSTKVTNVICLDDLIAYMNEDPKYHHHIKNILKYHEEYGVRS